MWDNFRYCVVFISQVLTGVLDVIVNNQIIRVFVLAAVCVSFIFLIIWFLEQLQNLELWYGKENGSFNSYVRSYRYSYNKNKKGSPYKIDDTYRKVSNSKKINDKPVGTFTASTGKKYSVYRKISTPGSRENRNSEVFRSPGRRNPKLDVDYEENE